MTYGLRSNPDPRGGAQFFQGVEARFLSAQKDVGIAMLGGAHVNQFIDIVFYARQTEDCARCETGAHGGNREPIRLCRRIGVVDGFHAGGAGHVFDDNCWIAGNVFFHERDERPRLHISRSSGLAAAKNSDSLALVVGCLAKHFFRDEASATDS